MMNDNMPIISKRVEKCFMGKSYYEDVYINREVNLELIINEKPWLFIICTPNQIEELVVGYLYGENIINCLDDIISININRQKHQAFVYIKQDYPVESKTKILTPGFGGGITFEPLKEYEPLSNSIEVTADTINKLFIKKQKIDSLYKACGGIHSSTIFSCENIIAFAEDIGRHNTMDKVVGQCLMNNIDTRNSILLTSGRISSEMIKKAARLRIPVLVSLSAATEKSITFAEKMNITLIGYCKEKSFIKYTQNVNY